MKIELSKEGLYWIERQADIERGKCLNTFNLICEIHKLDKKLAQKYTDEMVKLNTFLLTLIAKLEDKRQ